MQALTSVDTGSDAGSKAINIDTSSSSSSSDSDLTIKFTEFYNRVRGTRETGYCLE